MEVRDRRRFVLHGCDEVGKKRNVHGNGNLKGLDPNVITCVVYNRLHKLYVPYNDDDLCDLQSRKIKDTF